LRAWRRKPGERLPCFQAYGGKPASNCPIWGLAGASPASGWLVWGLGEKKPSGNRLAGLATGWFAGANRRTAAGGLLPKEGLAGAFFCGEDLTLFLVRGIIRA